MCSCKKELDQRYTQGHRRYERCPCFVPRDISYKLRIPLAKLLLGLRSADLQQLVTQFAFDAV